MAIVHAWRNCRRGRRWSYEDVEKELHDRDQEALDRKRDPESHRQVARQYSSFPCGCAADHGRTVCTTGMCWMTLHIFCPDMRCNQCPPEDLDHLWVVVKDARQLSSATIVATQ